MYSILLKNFIFLDFFTVQVFTESNTKASTVDKALLQAAHLPGMFLEARISYNHERI